MVVIKVLKLIIILSVSVLNQYFVLCKTEDHKNVYNLLNQATLNANRATEGSETSRSVRQLEGNNVNQITYPEQNNLDSPPLENFLLIAKDGLKLLFHNIDQIQKFESNRRRKKRSPEPSKSDLIQKMTNLLYLIDKKQLKLKLGSNSRTSKILSSEDEENLIQITNIYSGLKKNDKNIPSIEEMDKHRKYLMNILFNVVAEDVEENTKSSSFLNSTLSKYTNLQQGETIQNEGNDDSQETVIKNGTVLGEPEKRNENQDINISNRMGEPLNDLQTLDVHTAALLLHQMQTQGDVSLIPENLLESPNIHTQRIPQNQDLSSITSDTSNPSNTFEDTIIEQLHNTAMDGLKNTDLNLDNDVFGSPSEFSDFNAITDVLLAIEQLGVDSNTKSSLNQELLRFVMDSVNSNQVDASLIPTLVERLNQPTDLTLRTSQELTDAITTLLTDINTAFTTFFDSLVMAIQDQPALGVLLALAGAALVLHLFTGYFSPPKKGGGYGNSHGGGGGGGYHRRRGQAYDYYDNYRNIEEDISDMHTMSWIVNNMENFQSNMKKLDKTIKKIRAI